MIYPISPGYLQSSQVDIGNGLKRFKNGHFKYPEGFKMDIFETKLRHLYYNNSKKIII